jgi:hypothetical protein
MNIHRRKSDGRWLAPSNSAATPMEGVNGTSPMGALRREVVEKLKEAQRRLDADEPVKQLGSRW